MRSWKHCRVGTNSQNKHRVTNIPHHNHACPCTTTLPQQRNLPQSCITGTSNKNADLQQDCMLQRPTQTENHSQDSRRQTESSSNTCRSTIDTNGKTVVFSRAIVHNRDRSAGRMNENVPGSSSGIFFGARAVDAASRVSVGPHLFGGRGRTAA